MIILYGDFNEYIYNRLLIIQKDLNFQTVKLHRGIITAKFANDIEKNYESKFVKNSTVAAEGYE